MKKKKTSRLYSRRELIEYKKKRLVEIKEKYHLGQKFIQTEDYYGTKKGLICWVVAIEPSIIILFESGQRSTVPPEFCILLEPTDDYCEDLFELEDGIMTRYLNRKSKK